MVRPERFELPTYCSGGNRSIHLSYGRTPVDLVYMGELRSINVHTSPYAGRNAAGSRDQAKPHPCRVGDPRFLQTEFLPAAAAAATTTTSAAIATTSAATSAATVIASTAAASAAVIGFRPRLVHVERASADLRAV